MKTKSNHSINSFISTKMALLFAFFLLCVTGAFSQGDAEEMWVDYIYHSITVETDTSRIKAHIIDETSDAKMDHETYYYSYNHRVISKIRGGILGKLLHGEYTEVGFDGHLMRAGKMFLGLKNGIWKEWYPNGELKEMVEYDKGWKDGDFKEYAPDGRLLRRGKYKDGLLDGKVEYIQADGTVHTIKYKEGIKKKKRKKKEKKQKSDKAKNRKDEDKKSKEENSKKKKSKKEKQQKKRKKVKATEKENTDEENK